MSQIAVIKATSRNTERQIVPFASTTDHTQLLSETCVTDPEPSAIERELAQTRAMLDDMRQQLRTLEQSWKTRFDESVATAAAAVEAKFKSDDATRIAVLAKVGDDAITAFRAQFVEPAESIGIALAHHALGRFGATRGADSEFIAEVVRTEIAKLAGSIVIAIRLCPAYAGTGDIIDQLRLRLPAGCSIETDAGVASGTIRLQLRLGHIDVSVADGFEQLRSLLAKADAA
jgi:hypothetical protein